MPHVYKLDYPCMHDGPAWASVFMCNYMLVSLIILCKPTSTCSWKYWQIALPCNIHQNYFPRLNVWSYGMSGALDLSPKCDPHLSKVKKNVNERPRGMQTEFEVAHGPWSII